MNATLSILYFAAELFLLGAIVPPLVVFTLLPLASLLFGVADGVRDVTDDASSWKNTLDQTVKRTGIVTEWSTILGIAAINLALAGSVYGVIVALGRLLSS